MKSSVKINFNVHSGNISNIDRKNSHPDSYLTNLLQKEYFIHNVQYLVRQ